MITTTGLTNKQTSALDVLLNKVTKYLLYGGAAGGGKSWLGCYWLIIMCVCYSGSRWFIGRSNIKDTIESVLVTFGKVAKSMNFAGYKFNNNGIQFLNGSEIVFLDLTFYPYKDPLFERLGSKEFTGGWIEEGGEIHFLAFDVLKSRVGRHLNAELQIKPKILITCNPKKNWLYSEFYKPSKENNLPIDSEFIQALAIDNKNLTDDYIEGLKSIKDNGTKQRLLFGNWDYDSDPTTMLSFDVISDLFTNIVKGVQYYMIVDPAGKGKDELNISIFKGLSLIYFEEYATNDNRQLLGYMNRLKQKYNIPNRNICYDVVGVGNGLRGHFNGSYEFASNNKPLRYADDGKTKIYNSLRDDCGYKLEELANDNLVSVSCVLPSNIESNFKADLGQLKENNEDGKPKKILSKKLIKENIGRSPTWLDIFLMRMVFEIKSKKRFSSIS